ncbi:MAG TPA: class I SAM-dependent methyltransferase [Solirubrobacteraceae bacterium]|nr:class I SAM-dependent methyltransferase [Solirubrobacteraceae bacterium]
MRWRRRRAVGDVDVVPRGWQSPLPDLRELPPAFFERPSPLRGVRFDLDAQAALLRELAPLVAAFAPPPGFRIDNGWYESVDAELLDALLRRLRPRRVVELGSGWSSLVIAAALPAGAEHAIYDPYPNERAAGLPVRRVRAQDVPDEVFTALEPGDVLFVDTSHTVKPGGDVNRIVLEVLPLLAEGVAVHFHDVLLPYAPHRTWLERGWWWFEQYLLQAFLAGNPDWEVLLAAHALTRERGDLVREVVPSYTGETYPSAFWIRRTAVTPTPSTAGSRPPTGR